MADYKREHWVELYKAALLELDDNNLASCIERASLAVQQRLQELIGKGGNNEEERQALAVVVPDHVPVGGQADEGDMRSPQCPGRGGEGKDEHRKQRSAGAWNPFRANRRDHLPCLGATRRAGESTTGCAQRL